MKTLFLVMCVALLATAPSMAQMTEVMHFSGQVPVDQAPKKELHRRVRAWMRDALPEQILEKETVRTNTVSGTSFIRYTSQVSAANDMTQGIIMYDFEITSADNGITYLFTNFRHEGKIKFHVITNASHFPHKIQTVEKPWYDLVWKDLKRQLEQEVPHMVETLKVAAKDDAYTANLEANAK